MTADDDARGEILPFDRSFLTSGRRLARIGGGGLGGKAEGLRRAAHILETRFDRSRFPEFDVHVPALVVLGTGIFDAFLKGNGLEETAGSDDRDERIAAAFLRGDLPAAALGDLRAIVDEMRLPLAVRSSSLLEDALDRPFAGVYETKMTPNNQPERDARFHRLLEAVKFVYASTYFHGARSYLRAAGRHSGEEKMAVILQEVVGERFGDRFYPHLSGVARSWNFYPAGRAKPEEGVVNLALGLGKTIVDGGVSWIYSPAHPKAPPPFASTRDQMRGTQLDFWAVNLAKLNIFDPTAEGEYLVRCDLPTAELDGSLEQVASTYVAASDRFSPGVGAIGPRVINFAPLLSLQDWPLNALLRDLLKACEEEFAAAVEIEFAVVFPRRGAPGPARFGFLQVRPMVVSEESVEVADADLAAPDALVASASVLGNGTGEEIRDIVYTRPDRFEARFTRTIAAELEELNTRLLAEGRPYLLIGFGRWGSSDPWLGIPVAWGQIGGARAIVEATLPAMNVEPSQGSHFFHNISSFRVPYFFVHHEGRTGIDWSWLDARPAACETDLVRCVRLDAPLRVRVDGRTGRGVILRPE